LEVLWRISLKLGMSIYMDKTMMHAKWHCTTSVNNGVMALCIVVRHPSDLHPSLNKIYVAGDINSTNLLVLLESCSIPVCTVGIVCAGMFDYAVFFMFILCVCM
jgi:hypothetical protein